MSRKVSEMNTSKCEAMAKLDEVRSSEVNREVSLNALFVSNTTLNSIFLGNICNNKVTQDI